MFLVQDQCPWLQKDGAVLELGSKNRDTFDPRQDGQLGKCSASLAPTPTARLTHHYGSGSAAPLPPHRAARTSVVPIALHAGFCFTS